MKKCEDCGEYCKRRIRCDYCNLLICSWCYHQVHWCEYNYKERDAEINAKRRHT